MSVEAMSWARGRAPTAGAQLVLFGLADAADEHGVTWVGQTTLASRCSCGLRSVRDNMHRLERDGLIARLRRTTSRGHRTSDWIVLAPHAVDRGDLVAIDDDQVRNGRYPKRLAELTRTSGPNRHVLPAESAGGGILGAESAGRQESLPADRSIPTGRSLHPYRQIAPSLPAESADEQLVEQSLTALEPTPGSAPPAADDEAAEYNGQWQQIGKALSNGAHP